MRPANPHQTRQHMSHLLNRKLKGNRHTRVREHTRRAQNIAAIIWRQFQVGPYQYRVKHLRWYLETQTTHLKPATRYRYWLTTKNITWALHKEADWLALLQGLWVNPVTDEPPVHD